MCSTEQGVENWHMEAVFKDCLSRPFQPHPDVFPNLSFLPPFLPGSINFTEAIQSPHGGGEYIIQKCNNLIISYYNSFIPTAYYTMLVQRQFQPSLQTTSCPRKKKKRKKKHSVDHGRAIMLECATILSHIYSRHSSWGNSTVS